MSAVLRVVEARHRDAGRGMARVGKNAINEMGLVSGDVIKVKGKGTAPAIVWPGYPEDVDKDIIRIDGDIRSAAQVGIDDKVTIEKVEARPAETISLASPAQVNIIDGEDYLRRILEGRPVIKGQKIRVEVPGSPLTLVVTGTQPDGIVLGTGETKVVLKRKALDEKRPMTHVTYEDIGGLRRELSLVREMIELPLRHPELFQKVGIEPPRGVLLHGPPGTGKTLLAKAVANETDASFIYISGPEVMAKHYGESEERLRQVFEEAEAHAPAVVFIDELDSIAPKREEVSGEKQLERRVVAQLLTLMDGLKERNQVVVIAATNKPNMIDTALRRGGRFDREIEIGVPDRNGRLETLEIHTRGMPLGGDVDLGGLADITYGFVGADLASLCKEAAMHAIRKILPSIEIDRTIPPEVLERLEVDYDDFYETMKNIEPSAMREVFIEVAQVTWADVGGLDEAKQELQEAVEWPLKYPDAFKALDIKPPHGVVLYGPPGCGKTLLAKAVATESNANFISIKGPELFSRFVGESERAVRETFRRAKQASPCIIFFDEIDSIAPARGAGFDSPVTERVVSQILTEMDGIEELKEVVVIAATNRPDLIDPALMRPGRFDRHVYIKPPDEGSRERIFNIHLGNKPLAKEVSIKELAGKTDGYTGADIEMICREAGILALREMIRPGMDPAVVGEESQRTKIKKKHFKAALERVRPGASKDVYDYEGIAERFTGGGGNG